MPFPSTFSIVAVDRENGEIGVGVQSKFLSVGAAVPWVRVGVGAVATQAFCNTSFGPRGLDLLASGKTPSDVAQMLVRDDSGKDDRQFGIVDMSGHSATFSGARCIDATHGIAGLDFAVQGNCLASKSVVDAMAHAFRASAGHLADRIVSVLRAAQAAGGDKRGQQSAALVIEKAGAGYGGFNDRYVDLRVDDHATPIEELARLLAWHKLYYFPPAPEDVFPIDAALGAEIAGELIRIGALDAVVSTFDARAQAALVSFMHTENLENRERHDGAIDRQTLEYLRRFRR